VSAWKELSPREYDEAWDRFDAAVRFKPSVHAADWPSFEPPAPFITWSISLDADLDTFALAAFRSALTPGQRMFVLDWQHTCWSFDPHANFERWEIPVIANGDYSFFLAPQLEWGWLGHPWEESICVFGEPLLGLVRMNPLSSKIIRSR
jgi:hypothetical protein